MNKNLKDRFLIYEINWILSAKLSKGEFKYKEQYYRTFPIIVKSLNEVLNESIIFEKEHIEILDFFKNISEEGIQHVDPQLLGACWLEKLKEGKKNKLFKDSKVKFDFEQLEVFFFERYLRKIDCNDLQKEIEKVKKEEGYKALIELK